MAQSAPAQPVFRFGSFELDPQSGEVRKAGRLIRLQPQPFRVLALLIARRGQVVTRQEIQEEIWGNETFVDFEKGLNFCIKQIRGALGDDAEKPHYIETLPRRGYRFIGPLEEFARGPLQDGSSGTRFRPRSRSRSSQAPWVLAAVIALAGIVALTVYFRSSTVQRPTSYQRLPDFSNMRIGWLTQTGKCALAALSPDGRYLVHVLGLRGEPQGLWVTQLSTSSSVQVVLPREDSFDSLTLSHDGNWIYYVRGGNLHRVPLLGGASSRLIIDVDSPVSLSPDDKKIAFVREDVSRGESALMIASADGSEERKLTSRKLPDYFGTVAWSPDGKTLACTAGNRAEMAVSVVQVSIENPAERPLASAKWSQTGSPNATTWLGDGTGLIINGSAASADPSQLWYVAYPEGETRRITHDLNSYLDPSVTPDSRRIIATQDSGNSNLWVVRWGGWSQARQITSGTRRDDRPCWTPDGRIVYESGSRDLWIADADGSNSKQLTSGSGLNYAPSVTPDGHTVVFVSDRSKSPSLWRMDIDGGKQKQLTHGLNDQDPACSPDGRWVDYTSEYSGRPTVWRVPIDGGTPRQITQKLSRFPVPSPDGKLIATYYWSEESTSPIRLAIFPASGGEPLRSFDLSGGGPQQAIAHWALDGRSLVYIRTIRGVANLWSQPLDGGPARQLTNFKAEQMFSFDISRDSRSIVFSRGLVSRDAVEISGFK